MNSDADPPPTVPPRVNSPWQFSLLTLLAGMTLLAIGLGLVRSYPTLSIAFFLAAAYTGFLFIADAFARRATRQNWAAVTKIAWILVAILLLAMLFGGAFITHAVLN
jgi:hypothetical protein